MTTPASASERRRRAAASPQRLRLDRAAIMEVTLRLIDAEGVDGVSMRRVAAEFDTGPASLYAYFPTKDALLRAVYDQVSEQVEVPAAGPWQDVVRGWARSQRDVLQQHQDLARAAFAHIPTGERMLRILDDLLGAMERGGVPAQVAAWAVDIGSLYVVAHVYDHHQLSHSHQDARGNTTPAAGMASIQQATAGFAALDPMAYPNVHSHLAAMSSGDNDARFEFGLDLLIGGIEKAVAAARQ